MENVINNRSYLVGIDLGTTKIVAVIGEKLDQGLRIIAYDEVGSFGINRGMVENVQLVVKSINQCIENLKQKAGITQIDEITVGIAGQHIRCITNRSDLIHDNLDQEITQEEVRSLETSMYKLLMEPGECVLHVVAQHYNVDEALEVTDPVGRLGQRLTGTFHVIIGKTLAVKHTALSIKRANLKLENLILEPLASVRAVLTDDEREAGVVVIDMGGGTTDLVVYHDKIMRHTASIPFGGNNITEDVRKGCVILWREAEKLKLVHGSCLSSKVDPSTIIAFDRSFGTSRCEVSLADLAKMIEARMKEIMDFVMTEVEKSGYKDQLSAGIVFTGGGAMMKDLTDFVKLNTGYDVRIGVPLDVTTNTPPEIRQPRYATVIGLVLQGLDMREEKRTNQQMIHDLLVGSDEDLSSKTIPLPQEEATQETQINTETPKQEGVLSVFLRNLRNFLGEPVNDKT